MMTKAEIEAALQTAFSQCDSLGYNLSPQQKQILLQVAEALTQDSRQPSIEPQTQKTNPLDELTPEQRQAVLQFVAQHEQATASWKTQLLNDWLHGRDSGPVQFLRDQYGLQWLNRISPAHLAAYDEDARVFKVKLGDRLEVSHRVWEWVPQTEPDELEWLPCIVIRVFETSDAERSCLNCTVRLDNGLEYDVNGMYEWNRPHWRWPKTEP